MDSYLFYFVGVLSFVFLVGLAVAVFTKPNLQTDLSRRQEGS